ncbi:hypothetical protein RB595_008846 [Gaeumannomyces hyphopodioides]
MSTTAEQASKRASSSNPDQESNDWAPPVSKRRRIGLACNACRARKSRCDGQRPSCSTCRSLGFDCQYEPGESATNVIVRKEYMSDLEQRVTSVEHKLQRLNDVLKGHLLPCGSQSTPCCSTTDTAPFAATTGPATRGGETRQTGLEEPQDEDSSMNGMAMIFVKEHSSAFFGESSNINFTQLLLRSIAVVHQALPARTSAMENGKDSGTGESLMADVSHSNAHHPPVTSSHSTQESPPTALPSVEEMDSLLDIYFDTAGAVFPFIHEHTMRNTYAECRRNGFTRGRRTWLGTLNMIFALASGLCGGTYSRRMERSNVFYKRANELCGHLSRRVISLEMVHYQILVVIYCQGSQRSVQAWNNHGLLIQSAMALGLHTTSTGQAADPVQEEYRHRTWVVVYILDKILSVAFGRPSSVPDELVTVREVPAPGMSPSVASSTGLQGGSISSVVADNLPGEFLTVSLRLYQVMGKSLRKQYGSNFQSAGSSHSDDIDLLRASGELRKTLQGWAASLPPHLQLCEPESSILLQNMQAHRLRVILALRYHNLGILIHKPLLSATIRRLFNRDGGGAARACPSPAPPPYALQLTMAEAHECIRAAELTIDIVYGIISADSTAKNNLGAWFFTLYYVFTASLVISSRLLWALHGQNVVDEAAVTYCETLLGKVETIFEQLDRENSLVLSCLEYTRKLSRMCRIKGTGAPSKPDGRLHGTASTLPPTLSDSQSTSNGTATPGTDSVGTMMFNAEDREMFQLFSSEMFDPSIFEGFDQSPIEGISLANELWEGSACGGF